MTARPAAPPLYGFSPSKGKVHRLISLTAKKWDTAGIEKVAGERSDGWHEWLPVLPEDREWALAARAAAMRACREANKRRPREAKVKFDAWIWDEGPGGGYHWEKGFRLAVEMSR
jgi:hypothetical protein